VDLASGKLLLKNRQHVLSLDLYRLHWQIKNDGQMVLAGEWDIPSVAPGASCLLTLPLPPGLFARAGVYTLHLTVHQIAGNLWQEADAIVQKENFALPLSAPTSAQIVKPLAAAEGRHRLRLETDRHLLVLSGHRFWLVFNRCTAQFESWRYGDHEFLAFLSPTEIATHTPLVFSRRPLVQDRPLVRIWQELGIFQLLQVVDSVRADCDGERAEIAVQCRYGQAGAIPWLHADCHYTILATGQVDLKLRLISDRQLTCADLPRVAYRLPLRRQYDQVRWSGRGPGPTWPGVVSMEETGQFMSALPELMPAAPENRFVPVPHDQTNWVMALAADGTGLRCESANPFSFQVQDFSIGDSNIHSGTKFRQTHHNWIEWLLDLNYRPADETKPADFGAPAPAPVELGCLDLRLIPVTSQAR
jgi:hypothetical protein